VTRCSSRVQVLAPVTEVEGASNLAHGRADAKGVAPPCINGAGPPQRPPAGRRVVRRSFPAPLRPTRVILPNEHTRSNPVDAAGPRPRDVDQARRSRPRRGVGHRRGAELDDDASYSSSSRFSRPAGPDARVASLGGDRRGPDRTDLVAPPFKREPDRWSRRPRRARPRARVSGPRPGRADAARSRRALRRR